MTVAANQTVDTAIGNTLIAQLPPLSPGESFIVIVVGSLILATVIEFVGSRGVRKLLSRTNTDIDNIIFDELHLPLYVSVALFGLYVATIPLELGAPWNFYLRALTLSVIILFWSRALMRGGNRFFSHIKESEKNYEFAHIFENVWTFIVLIVMVFTFLSIWRVNITPLLASAGVAGVVIGFAAKDTVSNLFGGIALYFDNTYKVGDYIVLDSGEKGTVTDIGIRSTTVVTRGEVMITIPNAVLNSSKVINESNPEDRKRISVPIGIAYGTDIDMFEELVLEIAEEEELVLGHPSPRMRFRGFGDSALDYDLLCWVEAPLKDRKAQHELNREIYKQLNAAGMEIPYPKRDVYMREEAAEHARKQEQEEVVKTATDDDE